MIITFLDENRAVMVKGWFNKVQATAWRSGFGDYWRYEGTNERVRTWYDRKLDSAARKIRLAKQKEADRSVIRRNWKPVATLPEARLLK